MLAIYLVGLSKIDHYQFFPLVFVFVITIAATRFDGHIYPPSGPIAFACIALGLLFIAISIAIFSPWFAAIGFALIVSSLLVSLKEPTGQSLAILILPLLSLIRLPLNFDSLLVTGLQRYTSRLASWFLDIAAVPHMVSGNIIELVNRDLFVAEACSGIQSVFTLLFLASVVIAYRRRPLWMAPGYWAVALFVAVLCNSFRVAIVSAAASLGIDWATGLNHTLVGYVALALAFILLLSFDQCIDLIVHPIEGFVFEADDWTNPLVRHWDRYVVGWYGQTRKLLVTDNALGLAAAPGIGPLISVTGGTTATELPSQSSPQQTPTQTNPPEIGDAKPADPDHRLSDRSSKPSYAYFSTLAIAGLLVPVSLVIAIKNIWNAAPPPVMAQSGQFFQPTPGVIANLPASASTLGHEIVRDAQNPRLGDSADVWTIGTARWQGQLVLSQPYSHWHELCICYQNLQWKLDDRLIIPSTTPAAIPATMPPASFGETSGYVLATFQQGINGRGYLLFSAITYDGKLVSPPVTPGPIGQLVNRLSPDKQIDLGDIMMLQLWIETQAELSADDLDLAKQIFDVARDRLLADVRTKSET